MSQLAGSLAAHALDRASCGSRDDCARPARVALRPQAALGLLPRGERAGLADYPPEPRRSQLHFNVIPKTFLNIVSPFLVL